MAIRRRAFRGATLAVIVLAAAWTIYLLFSGGADFGIFGTIIRSHEPRRPLLIFSVALTAWLLSTSAAGFSSRWWRRIRVDDRLVAAAIAIGVLYIGVRYGAAVAGGADSYSYINQAQAWLRGPLKIAVPWQNVPWPFVAWTYAPFGYVPSSDGTAIVPVVAPGLPLLMAGASRLAGYCAMFWVVPLFGAVLIGSTYLLGARLRDSTTGVTAAALAATSPVFLSQLPQAMSDVPAAGAWTLAFMLLFSASRSAPARGVGGPGLRAISAGASGLATAVAVLIRPNLAPLAILLPSWLAFKAFRATESGERRKCLLQIGLFVAGLAPAAIILALFNWHLHGGPGRSGYGNPGELFAWSNVVPNLRNYLSWFVQKETVLPLAGLAVLSIPRVARWAQVADSSFTFLLGAFASLLIGEYLLYKPFDSWFYLRFLLPAFPLVSIGLALIVRQLSRRMSSDLGLLFTALLVGGLALRGVSEAEKGNAFYIWATEHRYVQIAQTVRDATQAEDLVIAGQFAGAVRYYAGRETLNYNGVEPGWLDRVVAWFQERGVRTHVLLDEWEIADFRKRFAGEKTLALLDRPPAVAISGAAVAQLYEFRDAPRTSPTVRLKEVPPARPECASPAEPPPTVPGSR